MLNDYSQSHEKGDRMESFFLSETLKYLYLMFDEDADQRLYDGNYVFSTEAHMFPVRADWQRRRTQDSAYGLSSFISTRRRHHHSSSFIIILITIITSSSFLV